MPVQRASNHLIGEKSPYLLQHAHQPVDWYPWGEEAFSRARREEKPVFLSIGYSTCHWCHVMARESFGDEAVAAALNRDFIAVKVDREERPDIDGVYMKACEAMTGSGGWPLSVFLTAEGAPFFAGTYFPQPFFLKLLSAVGRAWKEERGSLLENSGRVLLALEALPGQADGPAGDLAARGTALFQKTFDPPWGGFGRAPKFPAPHNLMFLLTAAPSLAETTLLGMYRGGIFDHVGGGFSRYSTDRFWLVPHFEKMLCDNALLAMAYLLAFERTGRALYRTVAERIFSYLERELAAPGGGFYAAQDADAEGEEGKYYLFTPGELEKRLGKEDGARFCRHYGITREGNFEGKSVPNFLHTPEADARAEALLPKVYAYRKARTALHTDTKVLTGWNALAAAAYAAAGRILKEERYLVSARKTLSFLERELTDGEMVFSGVTDGRRAGPGFLGDYADYVFALLQMHQATGEDAFLDRAAAVARGTADSFRDEARGGFFFTGPAHETLLIRPKETWDGALPSGNSVMAYSLSRLALLTEDERFIRWAGEQRRFMEGEAAGYPAGYGFYLYSLLPVKSVVCVPKDEAAFRALRIRSDWAFRRGEGPAYPPVNGETTFYVCENGACLPPSNAAPQ